MNNLTFLTWIKKNKLWAEKAILALVCCTYLALTGILVNFLSQPKWVPNETGKKPCSTSAPEIAIKEPVSIPQEAKEVNLLGARGKEAEEILRPIITEVATEHDIDPDLIKAIIWAESSFNPKAVSNKGAVGLMQLMPSTAKALGVEDCMNPETNIDAGVRYFKQLIIQFDGDEKLALAAYNAGSRKVREYNGIPPFETTRFYIKKVFKYYQGFKDESSTDIDKI